MRAGVQVGEGNLERRAIKAEKTAMRAMLYPVMQAEEDRRRAPQLPGQECCSSGRSQRVAWRHAGQLTLVYTMSCLLKMKQAVDRALQPTE